MSILQLLIQFASNFQRLPRKYSSDRNRDTSVPIIGTTGSTPLHFAAANGNMEVLNLLLLHGAHADRADKHGVTPEMVAEENGWLECSVVLRQWITDKDRDLREREPPLIVDDRSDVSASPPLCRSRRLHVKRSMDTALAMLKTADPLWKPREILVKTPESSLLPSSPAFPSIDPNTRRPSLPQITSPLSAGAYRKQKSPSPGPRPRSAGTDSDQDEGFHAMYGRGGAGRTQHGSKYSLLTIFKKTLGEEGLDSTLVSDDHSSHHSPALASAPIPGYSPTPPLDVRSSYSSISSTPNPPETPAHPLHPDLSSEFFDPSNRNGRITPQIVHSPPTSVPNLLPQIVSRPLAVEVQLALTEPSQLKDMSIRSPPSAMGHLSLEDRDPTSVLLPRLDERPPLFSEISGELEKKAQPSPNSRPGILRAHNRMASSAQGSPLPRMLRFDSTSSVERRTKDSPRGTPPLLRSSEGSNSMSQSRPQIRGDTTGSPAMSPQCLPIDDGKHVDAKDQDEGYDHISTSGTMKLNMTSMLLQRPRTLSSASPSDVELSPIDSVNDSSIAALKSEFPFSDDKAGNEDDAHSSVLPPRYLSIPSASTPNKRRRGDSLSSNSTSSENRSNYQTNSSARGTVTSPGILSVLASPLLSERFLDLKDFDPSPPADDLSPLAITSSSQSTTRSRVPTEINSSVVSSHADAEALVQQTRQYALDFAGNQEFSPTSLGSGHTPLSARLAAYGESLALEKKLREQKEASERSFSVLEATNELPSFLPSPLPSPQRSRDVVERQHSLRERSTPSRHRQLQNDVRRPSTAEGGVY